MLDFLAECHLISLNKFRTFQKFIFIFHLENSHFTELETHSLIRQKLENTDSDVLSTEDTIVIALICPLSRKILEKPVRGINCTHLDCFDLDAYVKLGYQSFKWSCPICSKFVSQTELKLDVFLMEIVKTLRSKDSNDDFIEIFKDFKWRSFSRKHTETAKPLEITICDLTNEVNSTIILSDDEDEDVISTNQNNENVAIMNVDNTDDRSHRERNYSNEMTILDESLEGLKVPRTLRPRKSLNGTIVSLEKTLSTILDAETELTNSTTIEETSVAEKKDANLSTCTVCNRTFKGSRGLKIHLSARTTTCRNMLA